MNIKLVYIGELVKRRSFVTFLGDERDIAGHCKSLISLDIRFTNVTTSGILLVLKHLPKLEIFKCNDNVAALAQMFQARNGPQPGEMAVNTFRFPSLYCNYEFCGVPMTLPPPYESGRLASAIQLCPFVVHVDIGLEKTPSPPTFSDKDLRALLHLKNLRHLSIERVTGITTFKRGLLPILQKFGPTSLESLRLKWFDKVNVGAVVQHCQKLRSIPR